jgi:superfamily I DNA and/or RNA helicase
MSLFERLDGHFKGQSINPVILLNRQYRMDPEIAAFPNNYIYEGKITNDKYVGYLF